MAKTHDCILWTGHVDPHGYPRRSGRLVYRVLYAAVFGPIPKGLTIAITPATARTIRVRAGRRVLIAAASTSNHLALVTPEENSRRMWPARKTACKNGHPFTPENTYIRPAGHRTCRACNALAARRYKNRSVA